jgi:hypothetical protein
MPSNTELFNLISPEMPWGDYGDILAHGMSMHLGRNDDGIMQLERTGPYIAPITFPGAGDIVVTTQFRSALENSKLTGFTFKPVIKTLIVELHWESWDLSADEMQEDPEDGEPENFILGEPHSHAASEALGDLWELCLEGGIDAHREEGKFLGFRPETWNGLDFFKGRTTGYNCVSMKAKQWFDQNFGEHVKFRPIKTG